MRNDLFGSTYDTRGMHAEVRSQRSVESESKKRSLVLASEVAEEWGVDREDSRARTEIRRRPCGPALVPPLTT